MASYNRVILVGNLTRDPQLSYLPSQTPVVELGLAVNRRFRDRDGQQREDTCFVDCRAYGKPAEIISQYTSKGRLILIEGRLQFDTWEAQDGSRRSKHRVIVENFQFLDSGGGGGSRSGPPPQRQQARGGGGGGGGGYRGGQGGGRPGPDQGGRRVEPDEPPPSSYDEQDEFGGGEDIPF